MRRRLLLGENENTNYVFSAATTSRSVSYTSGSTSINIKSTADGKNTPYVVYSYEAPVTAVTTAATRVTIRYSANTTASERSGSVVLKQNGSNKTITITVTQAATTPKGAYEAIVLYRGDQYGYYYRDSISMGVTDDGTIAYKPSWITATCSAGTLSVTAETANNSTTARKDTITITFGDKSASVVIIQLPDFSIYNTVDGHKYVPIASLKWAVMDVGTNYLSDSGGSKYKYGAGAEDYYKDSTGDGSECHTYSNPLTSSQDSATQVMGGGWRTPTSAECQTLLNSTTNYYAKFGKGICQALIDNNNNCITLEYGGYGIGASRYDSLAYWTANPLAIMYKYSGDISGKISIQSQYCYYGLHVRGVHA